MNTLLVRGGKPLYGNVKIGGSKNAALPLLFATLVTKGVSVFSGVPDIADVRCAISILRAYGAIVSFVQPGTVKIDTSRLENTDPPEAELRKIRASSYLIGASLGRFRQVTLGPFGGCAFCNRPIDMHIAAARAFGAQTVGENRILCEKLHGAIITFPKISVGATVNALLMAVCAEGDSVIHHVAKEPHVLALVKYLGDAGADIRQEKDSFTVHSTGTLGGAKAEIIPDMIEAGTYLLAGPLTGGEVTVSDVHPSELSSFMQVLHTAGVRFRYDDNSITAYGNPKHAFSVVTEPFPGFPTDLQPQTTVLMAKYHGGVVTESVFPERFGYLSSLAKFGVCYRTKEGSAEIIPSSLHPGTTAVSDLRGGASAVLTALCIDGESVVENADILLRGYENMSTKLSALGADVEIKERS